MTDQRSSPYVAGKDTSPLDWRQLSDHELATILKIERRLYDARSELPADPIDPRRYLQVAQKRDPRVLLLDGGRGTGKTSLLLTLVERWHKGKQPEAQYGDAYDLRIKRVQQQPDFEPDDKRDYNIPSHVSVLKIIDFDPLPPEMPLLAGIVQTWKPLAVKYDELSGKLEDCEFQGKTLMDEWHELFQIAAVGWTTLPNGKGLIEQILEREEQVEDWQLFSERWRQFVHKVIELGKCLKKPHTLDAQPVFVIMIDDVDLQVERIRELLPALRILYHPNVAFIVAADRQHMLSMLELHFLGQQRKLGHYQQCGQPAASETYDDWPKTLAKAAFQKVFPTNNIWKLNWLSLRELLAFPPKDPTQAENPTLKDALNQRQSLDRGQLGNYLFTEGTQIGEGTTDAITENSLPLIMSYRTAQQLSEHVLRVPLSPDAAPQTIKQLIGGPEADQRVRITGGRRASSRTRSPATAKLSQGNVEYLDTRELAALFPKGRGIQVANKHEVILSTRPSFVEREGPWSEFSWSKDPSEMWPLLLAISLRDDRFGVVASGLAWNVYLALAWTNVIVLKGDDQGLALAFQWQLHELPSPLRFLNRAIRWERQFVAKLSTEAKSELPRTAYAWIYYQLDGDSQSLTEPFAKGDKFNENSSWDSLLLAYPKPDSNLEDEEAKSLFQNRWRTQTLPLMARPELGLPPKVQERFLRFVVTPEQCEWLGRERRTYLGNAISAAAYQNRTNPHGDVEDRTRKERLAQAFEERYKELYNVISPWAEVVKDQGKSEMTA